MKRTIWGLAVLALALTLAAGCASGTPVEPTEGASEASASAGETALTFTGKVENELDLSMDDLKGMDVVERTMGRRSHPSTPRTASRPTPASC